MHVNSRAMQIFLIFTSLTKVRMVSTSWWYSLGKVHRTNTLSFHCVSAELATTKISWMLEFEANLTFHRQNFLRQSQNSQSVLHKVVSRASMKAFRRAFYKSSGWTRANSHGRHAQCSFRDAACRTAFFSSPVEAVRGYFIVEQLVHAPNDVSVTKHSRS